MNDELKQALATADWKDVVEWAKQNGYDPLKDDKVIKQRDSLMSAKAKAEYEANEHRALADAVKSKVAEKEQAMADKQKQYDELIAKIGDDPTGLIDKLTKYEEAEAKRKEKIASDLETKKAAWAKALNIKSDEIGDVVPDLGDVERTLEWMTKNESRLLGERYSPVKIKEGAPESDT